MHRKNNKGAVKFALVIIANLIFAVFIDSLDFTQII